MFKPFLNILWNNQNWFGRLQTLVIIFLVAVGFYFRTLYGIYKHKEIQRLKDEKTKLTEKVTEFSKKRAANNNQTKKITQSYKVKAQTIEQKRKADENTINHSTITDKQRNAFVSKYENR